MFRAALRAASGLSRAPRYARELRPRGRYAPLYAVSTRYMRAAFETHVAALFPVRYGEALLKLRQREYTEPTRGYQGSREACIAIRTRASRAWPRAAIAIPEHL